MDNLANVVEHLRFGDWRLILHTVHPKNLNETQNTAVERLLLQPKDDNLFSVFTTYKRRCITRPVTFSAKETLEITALDGWRRQFYEMWDLVITMTGCGFNAQGLIEFLDSITATGQVTVIQVYTDTSIAPVLAYGKCDYFEDVLSSDPYCWCRNSKYPTTLSTIRHPEVWSAFTEHDSLVLRQDVVDKLGGITWDTLQQSMTDDCD